MQVDFKARELTIKLVYYGPALSGKTTNLQSLHRLVSKDQRTHLMTLETRDDRTLFFDLLPMTFRKADLSLRLKVFTVPGQVIHNATRRLVLQGVDGVAFVADSQIAETRANAESFVNLKQNLRDSGLDVGQLPLVIQFNKRDMPAIRSDAELAALAAKGREPVFRAIAIRDEGVGETFVGLLTLVLKRLDAQAELGRKFGISSEAIVDEVCQRLGIPAVIGPRAVLGGIP